MTVEQRLDACPLLGGRPGDLALRSTAETVTYAELAQRVDRRSALLGTTRRLVLVEAANDVESVVTYLAALAGRHPVLLAAPGDVDRHVELAEAYRPDVIHRAGAALREVREGSAHDLHPDLAVLLSTSGSTGSPKLVRLSLDNVVANAQSIADYLGIRAADSAITSLPLHYCYGLSVLNSHLVGGAAVVLTDLSVSDECFWALATEARVTSLAGVPYTFDLLDASGFGDRDLPHLRYLTQAGGRMAPDRVREWAQLGRERGFDLFVMYGQTEATARMAYLPPDLALERPEAVGIAIPGGSFRLAGVNGTPVHVGELVYTGPNVMMGYAETPADLARGAELAELRTGDLARQADDGLWEVVGRLGRHAKLFGLRLDLDRVEQVLADRGRPVRVLVHDERLWVFTEQARSVERTLRAVVDLTGLPVSAIRVVRLGSLPRTTSGKPDYGALTRHATQVASQTSTDDPGAGAEGIRDLFAVVLGRPDATVRDSFVDLGGDSLSYVEVSTRLGRVLGTLPAGWQRLSPTALSTARRPRRRFTMPVDLSVVLRAVAVLLILVSHADIAQLQGGAHVLLAVAGYNLARFQLAMSDRVARVRGILRSAAAVAIPTAVWIGAVAVVAGEYRWQTALFLNGLTGTSRWSDDWQFWFLEALVWSYLAVAAVMAVPGVFRWSRRSPFGVALAALAVALLVRFAVVGVQAGPVERYEAAAVLWCLALGWAAAVAGTLRRRALVAVLAVVSAIGFFGDAQRELIVVTGVALLLVDRAVPVPRLLGRVVHVVAAASLWIYLTQWQVYPGIEDAGHPYLAVLAALAVGVGVHELYERVIPRVRARRGRRPTRRTSSRATPARARAPRAAEG
ncbi:AMP-binding protein [Nocardioides agariphilus]|uniref:AMP-binding protein n=1 Tax=Nocardioides agariphilus TaxID=433664 RepID=A0A930VHG3_9ACTN|nr:AMP-binding protein [Nocardioides agariphilus]MBF4766682.1 AMP-binding protein [Nocardioides agariphilus]